MESLASAYVLRPSLVTIPIWATRRSVRGKRNAFRRSDKVSDARERARKDREVS